MKKQNPFGKLKGPRVPEGKGQDLWGTSERLGLLFAAQELATEKSDECDVKTGGEKTVKTDYL